MGPPMLGLTQAYLGNMPFVSRNIGLHGLSSILLNWSIHMKVLPGPNLKYIYASGHSLPPMINNLVHLMEYMGEHVLAPSKCSSESSILYIMIPHLHSNLCCPLSSIKKQLMKMLTLKPIDAFYHMYG